MTGGRCRDRLAKHDGPSGPPKARLGPFPMHDDTMTRGTRPQIVTGH